MCVAIPGMSCEGDGPIHRSSAAQLGFHGPLGCCKILLRVLHKDLHMILKIIPEISNRNL